MTIQQMIVLNQLVPSKANVRKMDGKFAQNISPMRRRGCAGMPGCLRETQSTQPIWYRTRFYVPGADGTGWRSDPGLRRSSARSCTTDGLTTCTAPAAPEMVGGHGGAVRDGCCRGHLRAPGAAGYPTRALQTLGKGARGSAHARHLGTELQRHGPHLRHQRGNGEFQA
jgi:hypothetical protein